LAARNVSHGIATPVGREKVSLRRTLASDFEGVDWDGFGSSNPGFISAPLSIQSVLEKK